MKMIRLGLQSKIVICSLLLALLLCTVICTISYVSYKNSLIERYTAVAAESAELARSFVDGDRVAGYLETREKDEYYDEMKERFNEIKKAFQLMFFYMHVPDGESMNYIVEAFIEGDNPDNISDLGDSDELWDGSRDIVMSTFRDGPAEGAILITNEEYGYLATVLLPVYDSNGQITALIGADISMDMVITKLNTYILHITLLILAIVFGSILLALMLVRKSIIRPLNQLAEAAESFAKGVDTHSFEKIYIKSQDELSILASTFNKMADDIFLHIENVRKVTAEKERISAELGVATQIQADMLPRIFPAFPDREEFEIYATMQPAKEVGGDFYDFFLIDNDHLGIVIADVSGKSVPAALFMVIAKTLINNRARAGEQPQDVFINVNKQLCEGNETAMFVTAWFGVLEISSGKLTYVNAGHNPPLLKKAEGSFEYTKSKRGLMLAAMDISKYTQIETLLQKGDMLFLYTDGVTEANNINDELYGELRLQDLLNSLPPLTPTELLPKVKTDIDLFSDGVPQFDDITMLAILIH